MDQTTVASIYLGSVGGSEIDLRALLMLVEYTTFPTNKKPTNVGLDVVKRVELFQQYHLFYLPEVSCLYSI